MSCVKLELRLLHLTETQLTALLPPYDPPAENYTRVAFDVAVALVCTLSLLLCGRSILRGIILQQVRKVCCTQNKTDLALNYSFTVTSACSIMVQEGKM